MPRAQWIVAAVTVTLLCTGVGMLRSSDGAPPAAAGTVADSLPSRALGLSGHRRLVRELEHSGGHSGTHTPGKGARSARGGLPGPVAPMRAAPPVRLVIPALGLDVPLTADPEDGDAIRWDADGPAPGSAGTAVVTGNGLRLGELRRGLTIEIARADHRTAVFTVDRVSPARVPGPSGRSGDHGGERTGREAGERTGGASERRPGERAGRRAQLRLISGETAVVARLTGRHRTR
ncbi:class F sortase [Streptomyces sp. H27-G5]|uniref:class F sortase n=1 Tax=Streptomyces sp. H27-G5 TaxID=2996698 RepID=UPI00226E133F|nr:class F sortase [Streptomyces sp. H27-G5]MCY0919272.1 class F sortase [Streptomyces sp. H27-G5]